MTLKKIKYTNKQVKKTGKNKKPTKPKVTTKNQTNEQNASKLNTLFVLAALIIVTFIAYFPSLQNDFTNWDDNSYVETNPIIHELSSETLNEMFFSNDKQVLYHMGNYHPLTMLSLTIDHSLENKFESTFKTKDNKYIKENGKAYPNFDPYIYHLHNILLHIINSTLVFFFIFMLFAKIEIKNRFFLATATAFLFALTTIHVESVTWISERKDVLYTFYFLISAILYLKYLKKRNLLWIGLSFLAFFLSLLSKGQAVSLAVTLVAIDFFMERNDWKSVIIEKIPYFILAFLFGLIAIRAQAVGEAIHEISEYPIYDRILFASYGLSMYFAKLLIPFKLAAVYPYPYGEVPSYFWAFLIPLVGFITLFIFSLKRNKTLAFALAFFVINIFLVLQLLPVGSAIMADRYAYVPSIGFALILGYLLMKLWAMNKNMKYLSMVIFVGYSIFLGIKTNAQTKLWKDSSTLWAHTLSISPKAVVAWNNWGSAIDKIATEKTNVQEKIQLKQLAIEKFSKAVELKIDYAHAYYNRGTSLKDIGLETHDSLLFKSSVKDFNNALKYKPDLAEAYQNRAISKEQLLLLPEAIADFDKAIQLKGSSADLYSGRGVINGKMNNFDKAIQDFNKSIEVDPNHGPGYSNRGYAYYLQGNVEKALADYNTALTIEPDNADALFNRGVAYAFQKKFDLALADYNIVVKSKPRMIMLYINRGIVYLNLKKQQEACADFQTAANLGSPYGNAYLKRYCK